jgi:16S rRNA (uracil1498-N3)-methyltransferase
VSTLPLFLCPAKRLEDDEAVLDGPEGHHAAAVRRLRVGERLELTDGAGRWAHGRVTHVGDSVLRCRIEDRGADDAPRPRVVVVQALAKGDRSLTAVAAMTEVGVDEVVPWRAQRCVALWEGERGERALRRWRDTAREAGKQALRRWLPVVAEPVSTTDVMARLADAACPLVLDVTAERALSAVRPAASGDVVLVVGPEGGIADAESAAFLDAGAASCRLGPSVLRTSTAGAVAAGVVLSRTARWG